jgi:Gram-negative bacterial TonB protein C-terminal
MMKKLILFISIFYLSASFACGQDEKSDWQTYNSPKGEFSVETPSKMTEFFDISKDFKNENNEFFKYGSYKTASNGISYFVFSEAIMKKDPTNFTRFPGENLKIFIDENSHEKKSLRLGEFDGEFYTLHDSGDCYHNIMLIKTQNRSYIFHTISKNKVSEETNRFFNSIRLNSKVNNSSPKTIVVKKPILPTSPIDSTKPIGISNSSSDINIARIGEFNIGNEVRGGISGVPLPIQRQPIEQDSTKKSPLKIHSIIKPPYTNLARIYEITGVVRLGVTFKSDGTIGAVSVISGLPLGLTNNALIAAKQLHFAPAKTDDVPQTVRKIVEYQFTLY